MDKIRINPAKVSKDNVTILHAALAKMKLPVHTIELQQKKIGESTVNAIKQLQKVHNLPADGNLNELTLKVINNELADVHVTASKTRTDKLHRMLEKLNLPVAPEEKKRRITGDSTRKAIKEFQKKYNLPTDGRVTEDVLNRLQDESIKQTYSSKTQVVNLQKVLLRAGKIAKLDLKIPEQEMKDKVIGPETKKAIKDFQVKYKLPATGELDKVTLDRIDSVSASRGYKVKTLKQADATQLNKIKNKLRLNMVSPKVTGMQKALAHLGYKINEKEFKQQTFGKTTREAVVAYQKKKGLPVTGHVETDTLRMLNADIVAVNPSAATTTATATTTYRIRGSVRDELWQPRPNMVLRIFEKLLNGESAQPLATMKNHSNGFFDIIYTPPTDSATGVAKVKFHLVVKLYQAKDKNPANDVLIDSQIHYNVNPIHWVNFTQGDAPYKGQSDYTVSLGILKKALGLTKVEEIQETKNNKQVTQLAIQTGLSTDDIMRLILSHRAAKSINSLAILNPEVLYAFIRQNLPADLPGDLLLGSSNWETIDQLTEKAASGIIFLSDELVQLSIDNALAQNLVSQAVKKNQAQIIQEFKNVRTRFALQKPILTGNQNLNSLLGLTKLATQHYNTVANTFIAHRGINDNFWTDVNNNAGTFGTEAVKDMVTTVEIGNITKNHIPTLTFLKNKTGATAQFKQASDIAKLDETSLVNLIKQNGSSVPDNIPGNTTDEKVAAYANVLRSRSEHLFPAVSLVANIKKSASQPLTKIAEVEKFIDEQPNLNLRETNIDQYLKEKSITLDSKTKEELKVVQRIHKLTVSSTTGKALAEEGLHSSAQIYSAGKERVVDMLTAKGASPAQATKVYDLARMQYTQILARLFDFSPSINAGTPQAIIPQTYSKAEIQTALGNVPDLEALFGSLDYCECEHCKSLYGPAAYFTDMLRFLKAHNSLVTESGKKLTVKQVLLKRRPDLGNIKLNCENTNAPLPYIDLACEILENALDPVANGFSHQTTLPAKELRATPQYIVPLAYEKLATAEYPMNSSFNLWQEEARTYLNYLRAPRHQLMEVFQDISNPLAKSPDDATIAAEYFGISSFEKNLIVTQRDNNTDQDRYWKTNTTLTTMPVSSFLERSKLSYTELYDVLMTKFVDNAIPANRIAIQRPVDTCDTNAQQVIRLTVQKFDKLHRFIRLWRKTGWTMWELDLLVRNNGVGSNAITDATLVNLMHFKQMQEKLSLPFETMLAFYGKMNTEYRLNPSNQAVLIQPLYNKIFRNISITNPLDDHFKISETDPVKIDIATSVLANETLPLGLNAGYTPVPAILSALAINQQDFDLLVTKTNGLLSVASLSTLMRYVYFAKSNRLSIKDMLLLLSVTNTTDPFSSPKVTADCIKNLEAIRASGLTLTELDYVLNFNATSPIGLREEIIVQLMEALRQILAANKENIDKLGLSDANRTTLLAFDTGTLALMTDAQVLAAIAPLKTILTAVQENLKSANFSVAETDYILQFGNAPVTPAARANLTINIKQLQINLNALLSQNANQVTSHIAIAFGINNEQSDTLLNQLSINPGPVLLINVLQNANLLDKNPDGSYKTINAVNYPDHFKAYSLLHKAALLVQKMKIDSKDLKYFITNYAGVGTINFATLPIAAFAPPNNFNAWLNLSKYLDFKSRYPEPENASLRSILDLAKNSTIPKATVLDEIVKLTQWNRTELGMIDTKLQLKHLAAQLDYAKAETYLRIEKCFGLMKLSGTDATTMFKWAHKNGTLSSDKEVSQETRQAVKSKYEQDDWIQKVTPLHDDIREKKRSALVEYLIDDSLRNQSPTVVFNGKTVANPLYWKDTNALFKYFLIDVEMCSCQLTSRIKQAISSVQFFVQRCFLNLENTYVKVSQDEKEDVSSLNAWSQWKWMKNYRIWEANRKVFFYPENWLEPELRDDKSPFFQELENDLMQNEMTNENAETAFQNYLHKVDEVSRLEICGLYHEMEDLSAQELGYERNYVHVIGRTKTTPNVYYYRMYDMNYGNWTAWEKIETDIISEHVVPVVYNRKLHLFWLTFMEKPQKTHKVPPAKPATTDTPGDAATPQKMLEIQLGWVVRKKEGWGTKKISKYKLIHPWERPEYAYNLKPYYNAQLNELYLDIYLSTTREFNDGYFFDAFQNRKVQVTANRFNENYLPWHSSTFVFNGDVKDVKLKGLGGHFHFEFLGITLFDFWSPADSYYYVHQNFGQDGAKIKEMPPKEFGPRLRLPSGMHFHNTRLTNNLNHSVNTNELRVLEGNATTALLKGAITPFEMIITQQDLQLNTLATDHPVFYQDNNRAFFVKPEWEARLDSYGRVLNNVRKYRFLPFYHPYTTLFIRELNRDGIDGLLNRKIQVKPETYAPVNNFNFNSYAPSPSVIQDNTVKKDIVDFSFGGAYSLYNWEMFFHAPLMIAGMLSQNQRFEEAMQWYHYIFNPTDVEDLPTPQRYWITKPFYEYNSEEYRKQRIENILSNINLPEFEGQLKAWRNNPFKPHLIARYRPVAYQRNVVMKYIDNLIAWGDQLFRRDTIESINEASLLYMLAYEILGRRPEKVPNVQHEDLTFNEIETKLDSFGNARVDVVIEDTLLPVEVAPSSGGDEPMPNIDTFYFAIPNNDYLFKYWDTVEDRLYKIRHCMNIEGVVRQLPLFEPPIDPALLVKAAAAGIDLSSVLDDISAGTPYYRFRIVVQKAIEFCGEVKILGEKLLSALIQKDVEALSLLRSQHEIQLLEAVKDIKKKQVDEVVETIGSLNKAKEVTDERKIYYDGIPRMNGWEIAGTTAHLLGVASEIVATVANTVSAGIYLIPQFPAGAAGMGGTPTALIEFGGDQPGKSASKMAALFQGLSTIAHSSGGMLEAQGNYDRRDAENKYQAKIAEIEKDQIQFQINAAEIRQAIAERDVEIQDLQIDNAKTADDYMRSKYTNVQLHNWMITQISTVYFRAYQLAYDMAKKAEKCYQYELGLANSNIIQFGYWDSLKKGLLSGEKLMMDLRKLEASYIDKNKREFEITKNISLAQLSPLALMTLKETGQCTVSLPEWLFDMDYPGQYMRRIKNVSVSIPCVAGPFTSVNCTLSLISHKTRVDGVAPANMNAYPYTGEDDTRFRVQFGAISSIATSNGQNDSGMFELNFNDDRYLPFEGAGVISDWQINMPKSNNYFDFNSVTDVVLHVRYTARNAGGQLGNFANQYVQSILPTSTARLFSLRHEFGTEWYKFLNPQPGTDQELVINLKPEHYPFFIRGRLSSLKIRKVELFAESTELLNFTTNLKVTSAAFVNDLALDRDLSMNNVHHLTRDTTAATPTAVGEIRMKIKMSAALDFRSLPVDKITDLYMLVQLGS